MATLFNQNDKTSQRPLADRMRPEQLSEFVGQAHIVGQDKVLRELISLDKIPSMIFWGPPGVGKTTLAKIIAKKTRADFVEIRAVEKGVGDIKKIIAGARKSQIAYEKRTILFVDEIHRFNKAQQAIFLPFVEEGTLILIGATTENPSFEIISPLLSRCRIFILNPLSPDEIGLIIKRVLRDKEKGLGKLKIKITKEAIEALIGASNGDARVPINALETSLNLVKPDKKGVYHLNKAIVHESLQKGFLIYDKAGEEHYNVISAFIKSMRGSDPDAALYWLARMIEAGEDARFIARRMVIFASEDIGNADPRAISVATAAAQAVEFVGMPEAQINLAQAATYLSLAPKSNASYKGLLAAREDVKKTLNLSVPLHLRNAPTQLMKKLGYGKDYKYPHNHPEANQDYLPEKLKGKKYYKKS